MLKFYLGIQEQHLGTVKNEEKLNISKIWKENEKREKDWKC